MCGIAGLYAFGDRAPPIERNRLVVLRDAMASRGPDALGEWVSEDGRLGFGHRRLAIIDLSDAGRQPMHSADGRYVITFNGEIYNYRALQDELRQQGYDFRSASDTEVLLHLFDRHGPAMVSKLRGMFALAIWDRVERGLFLARDPLGIKPLYYRCHAGEFQFASQVKAIRRAVEQPASRSAAGTVGFHLLGFVPDPFTIYDDVRALPAGSTLWVDSAGPQEPRQYFSVSACLAGAGSPGPADGAESSADLRAALLDSVRHHLVSDVPVGVFLSAGLDSATITALASEVQGASLKTLTLGFSELAGGAHDEMPLAERIAAHYGTEHQSCIVSGADFQSDYERLLQAMDQPSIDGPNVYFVSKVAAAQGLKVALSGLGGDELFGGYVGFRQIPRLVGALGPLRPLRTLGAGLRKVAGPVIRRFTSPKYAGLFEYGTSVEDAYLLRRALFMPWELPKVLDPDLVRAGWSGLAPQVRLRETIDRVPDGRAEISALEMTWYMRSQLLRDADWASMAHSLEVRVPLVDSVLLETIAPELPGRRPPGKRDMARTPSKPLPEAVLNRPKSGFAIPIRDWLRPRDGNDPSQRGLRPWALEVFERSTA